MKPKLLFLFAAIALFLSFGVWFAGTLIVHPQLRKIGEAPKHFQGRSVEFESRSGATLHGWFLPGNTGAGAVILLHGVRADRLAMLGRADFLHRAGYAVLLFDFQAHGESGGDRITLGWRESQDAISAIKFLRKILPEEKIGVIGVSMGGAAAILAKPPLEVTALVLEQVYPTIAQAAENRIALRLGEWSRMLSPLLLMQLKPRLGIEAKDLRPIDRINEVTAPKLLIAGAEDQHTTLEESKSLFDAAQEPKELWVVPYAGHIDLHRFLGKSYENKILSFFETKLRASEKDSEAPLNPLSK